MSGPRLSSFEARKSSHLRMTEFGSARLRRRLRQLPRRLTGRHKIDRPQVRIVDVLQRHRHHTTAAVDVDTAEELQPEAWREVLALLRGAALQVAHLRPKRVVEIGRTPA